MRLIFLSLFIVYSTLSVAQIPVNMLTGMKEDIPESGSDRILIFSLYDAPNFRLSSLHDTLSDNGFDVIIRKKKDMSADSLSGLLMDSDQLWLVSDYKAYLDSTHLDVVSDFLNEGNALYILADNEPYDADAEFLSNALVGAQFEGNYIADDKAEPVWNAEEELTTNVNSLYEGFTVSSISMPESVKPEFVGSDGQVFIASYASENYKILLDGGFTRMYTKWTQNSAAYFVNAARWLESE